MSDQSQAPSFLYVEDDEASRQVLEVIMSKVMGYDDLTFFENSTDFMARLKALPAIPVVIFLDIQVRPLNGYQMIELIRADQTYQNTKIIAITSSVMASDVAELRKAGFDGMIGKPLVLKMFPGLLRKILSGGEVWYIP